MAAAWASFALLPLVLSATPWPADASARHSHTLTKTASHDCGNRGRGRVLQSVDSQYSSWWMKTKEGIAAAEVPRTRRGRYCTTAMISPVVASSSTIPGFVVPSRGFFGRSSSTSGGSGGDGKIAQGASSRSWGTITAAATTSERRRQGRTTNEVSNKNNNNAAVARMFSPGAGGEAAASRRFHNSGFFGRVSDRAGGSRYSARQPPQARISRGPAGVPGWSQGGGRGRGAGSSVVVVSMGAGETEYYTWTETDTDVELRVPLPAGTSAKSIQLALTKRSITLGLKGREGAILQGKLVSDVQPELSNWTMEEEESGKKMLYIILQKVVNPESGLAADWLGVLEGEEHTNFYYPETEQDFDVNAYVKKMGYDPERDAHKVDKTMFSDLTENMRNELINNVPKTAYVDKEDMTPAVAEPKVSPVIDTGVLGVQSTQPAEAAEIRDAEMADNHDRSDASGGKETTKQTKAKKTNAAKDKKTPSLGMNEQAEKIRQEAASIEELTPRQREIALGLRHTYEKMIKKGMIKPDYDESGERLPDPDMEELAKEYDLGMGDVILKQGGFSQEEVTEFATNILPDDDDSAGDMDLDLDLNDPAVRDAFGLD